MHEEQILVGITAILGVSMAARWLAWRLNAPSILLLLVCGLVAGPGTGLLDPDAIFGDVLFPFVSIFVGIILFEGGLSLDMRELREVGGLVRNLVTVGAAVTWAIASFGAWLILGLPFEPAVLMGAIFVVTGPTVVIPLLRHVRPTGRIRVAIKWEGILNDPVGAILAVLVYEAIAAGGLSGFARTGGGDLLATIAAGTVVGLVGAALIVIMLRFHWVPDLLDNLFSLSVVVGAFTVSNEWRAESGLLATTIMGVALANQRFAQVKQIVEFKEHLRVLMISTLFIVLAARLKADSIEEVLWPSLGYLALLLFIARPLAVWFSSIGSKLSAQEKIFLSWMAPRGIVAAAVSSIFAERLVELGVEGAEQMVPISFIVIIGTVTIYSLTAFPLARRLKLAEPSPQGVLFVGAHSWAREVAKALKKLGFEVSMADSQWSHVTAARQEGLTAYYGSILSQRVLDEVNLYGIGRLLAVTSNDEANSLASIHFAAVFERKEVYQLVNERGEGSRSAIAPMHLQGRGLFGPQATFEKLWQMFQAGATVKTTPISEKFTYADFRECYGEEALPLFIVTKAKRLTVVTAQDPAKPRPGQMLVAMVPKEATAPKEEAEQREQAARKKEEITSSDV